MNQKKHKKLCTFAIFFASLTAVIHLINRMIVHWASLTEILNTPEKQYYRSKFGKIHYTKHGNGSPILLIHDAFPGSSGYEWNQTTAHLAAEHSVYTIDLPGYGRSDKSGITYTSYLYVQLICDFIKKVIGEKTSVLVSGNSCPFVIMASSQEKELFHKIILINPPSPKSLNLKRSWNDRIFERVLLLPVFGTFLYHIIVSRETIQKLFSEKLYKKSQSIDKNFTEAYYEAAHIGGYYAKYAYISMISKKLNTNLTLGITSAKDNFSIIRGIAEPESSSISSLYQKLNSSISCYTITNARHYPQIENPKAFLEKVERILAN